MSSKCSEKSASHSDKVALSAMESTSWEPAIVYKPFKLLFSSELEQGRSNISSLRPLILPDIVTGKFYSRLDRNEPNEAPSEEYLSRARRGPRDQEQLTSQDYGKYVHLAPQWQATHWRDRRMYNHIRDSHEIKFIANANPAPIRLHAKR